MDIVELVKPGWVDKVVTIMIAFYSPQWINLKKITRAVVVLFYIDMNQFNSEKSVDS